MRIILREEKIEYKNRSIMPVKSPAQAIDAAKELKNMEQECCCVLNLSSKNNLISSEIVTLGLLNSCLMHPREIFKQAIIKNASAIVLLHNHPSGDPTPSKEDIKITKNMIEAGKIIGIDVLDHIIVGNTFLSMREEGVVQFES